MKIFKNIGKIDSWPSIAISILLFFLSLVPLIFNERRREADGFYTLYFANTLHQSFTNLLTYIPSPAPQYFPEITLAYLFQFLFHGLEAWQQIAIINFSFCLLFAAVAIFLLPKISGAETAHGNSLQTHLLYAAIIISIAALVNFHSDGNIALFWLDGANSHIGSYLITPLTFALIFTAKTRLTFFTLLLICMGGFASNRLLLVSTAIPLLIILLNDSCIKQSGTFTDKLGKNIHSFAIVGFLAAISFLPLLFFTDYEVSQRHVLTLENITLTINNWKKFFAAQFIDYSFSKLLFLAMSCLILVVSLKLRHLKYFQFVLISLALTISVSFITGSFRGWNLRLFIPALFSGLVAIYYLRPKHQKLILMILSLVLLHSAATYTYKFTRTESRELQLATCLKNLRLVQHDQVGLAGHWDAEPVNYYLGRPVLRKANFRDGNFRLNQWMVNVRYNQIDKPVRFIIENKANGFYWFNSQTLSQLPGHEKILTCADTNDKIHLYEAETLTKYLRDKILSP